MARDPTIARLFVGEQRGRLLSFPTDPMCDRADLVVDLSKHVPGFGHLYGMAFHPRFAENRKVYLCYVLQAEVDDGSRVSEFTMDLAAEPRIRFETERLLLTFRSGGHNGGCLEFGPDGCLYIATGDAAGPNPPDSFRTGQNLDDLLSCVLRIDVDRREAGLAYAIPKDNPFVGRVGARGEIWCYGLRNPWKLTFDRATGALWTADVGWDLWEMVYLVERGANYGWSASEGSHPVGGGVAPGPTPIVPPLLEHPHSEAASLTGGYVYYGSRFPELRGAYVYGDYQTGRVWALWRKDKKVTAHRELARTPLKIVAFGENAAGELYLLDHQGEGQIWRFERAPAADPNAAFPRRLSESGLFSSVEKLEPGPGVVPYEIIAAPFEDSACAERWVAVRGGDQIHAASPETWAFPDGAVLVKTVFVDEAARKARKPVETQLLHFEAGSWRPYTYAWDGSGRDAALVPAEGLRTKVPTANGAERAWKFSSRVECTLCHNFQGAGNVLGVNTLQLNRDVEVSGEPKSQLRQLEAIGLLRSPLPDVPERLPRLTNPAHPDESIERRARSFLHVNCSHCHDEHRGGQSPMRLGFTRPREAMAVVDTKPLLGGFGLDDPRIVAPGDATRSVLFYRLSTMGGGHMPRLGPRRVDRVGVDVVASWITSLGAPVEPTSGSVEALLGSTRGALQLVRALSRPDCSPETRHAVLDAARGHARPEVRGLFRRFLIDGGEPEIDAPSAEEILTLKGDRGRGEALYFRDGAPRCATCHTLRGKGGAVGPDLSQIGKKHPRGILLAHILEPSREIAPEWSAYVLVTTSGETLSGLLTSRTEKDVVLKDAQGVERRMPRSAVKSLDRQSLSLMPEGLLDDLSASEAADLLELLTQSQ